ncbi:MAG: ECF transporter S component [Clostridiales bacterium]|nr:ECF transporter S component [Clostridiales bacterium]
MEKSTKKLLDTRQLSIVGMLSAISIFMGLTGIGFITLPFMKATIMHIPVIIGAIIEGPVVGGIVGLVFGLFSIYQNITSPTALSPIFMNPIVAIIPRVLIGIVSYYVYKFIKKKFKNIKIAYGASALFGTLTNTIGVLGLTYILFSNQYAVINDISSDMVLGMLSTIVLTNGLPEAILTVIIVIPVVSGIRRIYKG